MSSFCDSVSSESSDGRTKVAIEVQPIGYYSASDIELGKEKGKVIAKPLKNKAIVKPRKRKAMNQSGDERPRKKPKKRVKYPPPSDDKYKWVSGGVERFASIFTNEYLRQVVSIYNVCSSEFMPFIELSGCNPFERVYMSPSVNVDDYTYVYDYMARDFAIQFPLSSFECHILNEIQTTPSQLHPNTWALLKVFQILCKYLSIQPTVNKFMFFYQMKYGMSIGWISLALANTHLKLFTLYKDSFKEFKNTFFKVKPTKNDPLKRILFDENNAPRFPLYWLIPNKFKSRQEYHFTTDEKVDIQCLIDFRNSYGPPLPIKELMDSVDAKDPVEYLNGELRVVM